jgi:hypothetical protein
MRIRNVKATSGDADAVAIRSVIADCYAAISGPAGIRDWNRHSACFADAARLTVVHETRIESFSVREYQRSRTAFFATHAFFERETHGEIRVSGHVAHAFSFYESRWVEDDPPFESGVNSVQLILFRGGWLITGITWAAGSAARLVQIHG